jgi:TPR repeat protein
LISSFNTTNAERQTLERQAAKGDAEAATKLGNFYALVLCDNVAASHWYKRAAALGGEAERGTYESFVQTLRNDE